MSWAETFRTAYDAIRTRRLRSALTMLGILIGIAAVMLTVGLGQGATQKVTAQIDQLGSNLLIVSPGSTTSSTGVRGGRGSATTLTTTDASLLGNAAVVPDVAAVAPTSTSSQELDYGDTNWTTSVVGTTPSWLSVRARSVQSGRFITQQDVDQGSLVTVIGSTTASEPERRTVPDEGTRSPASTRSSVVLPAPFSPTRPTRSPAETVRSSRSSTGRPG